jgi:type III secretory pathway component EscT
VTAAALPALAAALPAAGLLGLRFLPAALLSPFLGGPLVPAPVRIALALGLGLAGVALSAGTCPPPADAPGLLAAALRELTAGTALAFLASLPVDAARAAGRLADTFRGATLCELHVAPIRQRESAAGDLLAQWVVVLAAAGGGHRLVVEGLVGSVRALPPGAAFPPGPVAEVALRAASELLASACAVAAPAAAGVLAADLAVALAARVAPQVATPDVALPARAAVGLLALAAGAAAGAGRLVALVALPGSLAGGLGGFP